MPTRLRSPELAARLGIALAITVTICFITGLISHFVQYPVAWLPWPPFPSGLYRFTQGLHVISGVATIPLLLVKLWSVYPRLFERPMVRSALHAAERGSIAVLVGSMIFMLVTGLFNAAQWYPWTFFFPAMHYAFAWVAVGALVIHIAVKLPVITKVLRAPIDPPSIDPPGPAGDTMDVNGGITRRGVLAATGAATVLAVLSVAGQTVPWLRSLAILAPRSGEGPQGVPINRTARAAGVTTTAVDPAWTLEVRSGTTTRNLGLDELRALPQTEVILPIACVEGWSATARWRGVRVRDLIDVVGGRGGDVQFLSLEQGGLYSGTVLPQRFAEHPDSLVALEINGETLNIDHGYPCRLIAPNRPGVLQTKWLASMEVLP
ncbi:molybdopterin-dependent oxidoreductase [Lolliginicoccus levis]|uniref:molybdopterin-dependent oxidoreductase n=1 Tax=Lolliginicoccus levis TaxID=2919542 RepID=UPI00241D5D9B|nr:molybdopterin-dependent oxidoreductase [Lolliginicoccus levis]